LFASERLIDAVNPFIGTGGDGFGVGSCFPGPQAPFGMVRPSPDTSLGDSIAPFYHCGGYWYGDNIIRGFSHTRLHGVGVPGLGNIMIMPAKGNPADMIDEKNYRSPLDHKLEHAHPGYYSVILPDRDVKVEITSGYYTAHHRYTFDEPENALLVLNASHYFGNGKPIDTNINIDSENNEITGWFFYGSPLGKDVKTFFLIKLNQSFDEYGTWTDSVYTESKKAASGTRAGAVFKFNSLDKGVMEAQVTISFISIDKARENMALDHPSGDFETLRQRTEKEWEDILNRITVKGGSPKHREIFYTALYHSFLMPTLFSEAGGDYLGLDNKVHKTQGFKYYTDFSMWDTFRTFHPLITLIAPEYQRDMNISIIKMYEQGGYIPKWPVANAYTGCMIGSSADIIIADSYLKGIKDFDIDTAYKGITELATIPTPPDAGYEGRSGIADYMEYGYHPSDKNTDSTSKTLEFSYNDYAIAQLAKALGKNADYDFYMKRAESYRNVWNPERDFFEGRDSEGKFAEQFNDISWREEFTEGTAWQWLWFVPHDVEGLIDLFGSKEKYYEKLDRFFKLSHKEPDTLMSDKYYWHGNEPDLYAAYMFLWAGRPDRTQEELRWIMRKKYSTKDSGLDGNDDGGTLSAWYVFNAAGFMPFPATNKYFIGSPIFTESRFKTPGGDLVIRAKKSSGKTLYVKGVKINGKSIDKPYFTQNDIASGGEIIIDMSAEKSDWGNNMAEK